MLDNNYTDTTRLNHVDDFTTGINERIVTHRYKEMIPITQCLTDDIIKSIFFLTHSLLLIKLFIFLINKLHHLFKLSN